MKQVRPTRFYSNKQEKKVAKSLGGKQVPNSGATPYQKGDVQTSQFLIECKTVIRKQKQVTVYKEWLEKNREEAFAMNKPYNAVTFDFGDGEQFYIINESLFKQLVKMLEEENELST